MDMFGGARGRKDNSGRRGVSAQKKAQRRMDAQVRQAVYDSLSLEQKLRGAGKKQTARLLAKG